MLDLTDVDLEVGDSTREVPCPKCHGGTTNEKSFVVTRTEEGYVFVCHRASCTYAGATYLSRGERAASVSRRDGPATKQKPSLHKYKGEITWNPPVYEYMVGRFGVGTDLISDTGRAMFPVFSPTRDRVGWVARAYPGFYKGDLATASKTINYQEQEYDLGLHFPIRVNWFSGITKMVVVEDWVSAEKLSRLGYPTAALLGTNLSFDVARELRDRLGVKELVVCLDFDALSKAAQLKRELGLVFDKITIQVLTKDPKDTPEQELRDVFG